MGHPIQKSRARRASTLALLQRVPAERLQLPHVVVHHDKVEIHGEEAYDEVSLRRDVDLLERW